MLESADPNINASRADDVIRRSRCSGESIPDKRVLIKPRHGGGTERIGHVLHASKTKPSARVGEEDVTLCEKEVERPLLSVLGLIAELVVECGDVFLSTTITFIAETARGATRGHPSIEVR